MRIQKKTQVLALMLALLMLLSACGGNTQSPASSTTEPNTPADTTVPPVSTPVEESADVTATEKTPDFYTVNGLSYPSELGKPILSENAAALASSASLSSAAEQITNVGDAIYYLQEVEAFDQPFDTCTLFATLLEGDYEEIGRILLTRPDNGYCLVYIKSGTQVYPFDPFMLAKGDCGWFYDPASEFISASDLDTLGQWLMETCPYNGENKPMTAWESNVLSTGALQENTPAEPIDTNPTPQPPDVSTPGIPPSLPSEPPSAPGTPEEKLVAYLTTPQYTKAQIDQWVAEGLTVTQWAEKIKVPADAVQMLNAINYRENEYNDNASFPDDTNQVYWAAMWNAREVFAHRSGNCGGTSNLMNFLLSGDFDQQGYVVFSNNTGGHIFNYFVSDGIYVMCDFIGIPNACIFGGGRTYSSDTDAYVVYVGTDVGAFGNWYRNEGFFANGFRNSDDEMYLYNLVLYRRDGSALPRARDMQGKETQFGNNIWDVYPEQYRDDYTILYEHEDYPIRFLSVPDPKTWPAEIR